MTACPTERFLTVAAADLAAAEREARAALSGRSRRALTTYACTDCGGAHIRRSRIHRITRTAA